MGVVTMTLLEAKNSVWKLLSPCYNDLTRCCSGPINTGVRSTKARSVIGLPQHCNLALNSSQFDLDLGLESNCSFQCRVVHHSKPCIVFVAEIPKILLSSLWFKSY